MDEPAGPKISLELKAVSDANTQFTLLLHNALRQNIDGNLVYSPFSLGTIIAMARMGADGTTAEEITTSLKFSPAKEILADGYSQLLSSLQTAGNTDGNTLSAANLLFMKAGFKIIPEFQNVLKNSFKAEAKQLNFSKKASAAGEMNHWIEIATHEKIKNLILPAVLNEDMKVILVNVVYFKGHWAQKFNRAKTRLQPFYISETKKVQASMMKLEAKIPYGEIPEIGAQAVALPYKGNRLCMLIIVPKERSGLSKIESAIKDLTPKKIFSRLNTANVTLLMPKFKLETTLRLRETLQKLGITTMFSTSADFSGITNQIPLWVAEVIQKTFIEVNEEGSEAAAVTANDLEGSMPTSVDVKANRPFLFQIIDRETEFILFSGLCTNPTSERARRACTIT